MVTWDQDDGSAGEAQRPAVDVYESSDTAVAYDEASADGWLRDREAAVVDRYFTDRDGRLLDLGCGTGRTTAPLAERGYDVVGVDVSAEMVARARRRHPELSFAVGDATDLDYDDDSFDYVLFSYYGLDCIAPASARRAAIAEAYRVLAPGGRFAFSSHNGWYLLPALLSDPEHVWTFYVANGNLARLRSRYRRDPDEYGLDYYRGSPRHTKAQLREAGFEPLAVVGKRDGLLANFEIGHYYVAEKPRRR